MLSLLVALLAPVQQGLPASSAGPAIGRGRYLQALGPAGEPVPAYVPADRVPEPPFAQFPD